MFGPTVAFWNSAMSRRAIIWLIAFCIVASFVYVLIQAYWANLLVPVLRVLGVYSRFGTLTVIVVSDVVAALLAACILVCPLILLARRPAVILGFVLGMMTILSLVIISLSGPGTDAVSWIRVVEYAAFVLFCTLVGHSTGRWVSRGRAQPFAQPDAQ